jgi:hypothetical protein
MSPELSHVGMGYALCPICHKKHDETVLLDKRLRKSLPRESFTGFELCPEHEAMRAEYIALVEVSNATPYTVLKPQDAVHTGRVAHVRRTAAKRIFNVEMPDTLAFVYIDAEAFDKLEAMNKEVQ